MKKIISLITFLTIISLSLNAQVLSSLEDSASYSIGINLGNQLKSQGIETISGSLLLQAIQEVLEGKNPKISQNESIQIIQKYMDEKKKEKYQVNIESSKAFLESNAKRKEVITLPSGLQYEILVEGTGEKPTSTDKVEVHYHGTLIDGTVFDSSVQRGQPASFQVNRVIQGWIEALQLMPVGSKWKLYIPEDLAYGSNPRPGGVIEPYMALIFEVELISIVK